MSLRQEILEKINQPRIRAKIVLASPKEITDSTVKRWIRNDDDALTKLWLLNLIKEELGITENEIFEPTHHSLSNN
jgi:hypothetical protein